MKTSKISKRQILAILIAVIMMLSIIPVFLMGF
jgi:preprotein translocase subunit SecE